MFTNIFKKFKKKSLKERFLLVIGILFFLSYFVLGLMIIFLKNLPISLNPNARWAFGILLIVYALIRFVRLMNSNKQEQ